MTAGIKGRFDWFVVLAGMRTGSNLLESHLNGADGVTCHGEVFNPNFIGWEKHTRLFGIDLTARDADPEALLSKLRQQRGLNGFRLFHDHDPRVLSAALSDPRCAKVVLTRTPLMSYLSLGHARATGQWKLGNTKDRKEAKVSIDPAGFAVHVRTQAEFQQDIRSALTRSGQTAFYIDYDDLTDLAAINGLLAFLGAPPLAALSDSILRQNPTAAEDRLHDARELSAAIAAVDWAGLGFVPATEPKRGPQVPAYIAARGAPVLFIPVAGRTFEWVENWLASLASGDAGLDGGFTQKSLRTWMKDHPRHRVFTVVSHPVSRAFSAFGRALAGAEDIRRALASEVGLKDIPVTKPNELAVNDRRDLFVAFLRLVRLTLEGRTRLRLPPDWATQSEHIAGFASFRAPDVVLREYDAAAGLARLAEGFGVAAADALLPAPERALSEIADTTVDTAAQATYGRDFINFGFGDWSPQAA